MGSIPVHDSSTSQKLAIQKDTHMRARNLVIEGDSAKLESLLEDYQFIGFDTELRNNKLTVYCVNRKLKSRKQRNREAKQRNAEKKIAKAQRTTRS